MDSYCRWNALRRVFEFKPSTIREKPRQKRGTSKVPSQQVWPQHDATAVVV